MMADLAFWLHEYHPGGAAPLAECRDRLVAYLTADEGYNGRGREPSPMACSRLRAVKRGCSVSADWGNTASFT